MEKAKELKESLFRPNNNGWETLKEEERKKVFDFSNKYINFINTAKTERECVKVLTEILEKHNFKNIESQTNLKAGDKVYYINRNKNIYAAVIGSDDLKKGFNIVGAHIDSPRLDLKPNPLYECEELAFLKTHYYGGIKKYQWVNIPLSMHGVIMTKDNKKIEINIGENENDPIFTIADLLPHLSSQQEKKKLQDAIAGEDLNILVGSIPYETEEEITEKVKLNILNLLNKKYGIVERDFVSSEIEFVPSMKAKSLGFDEAEISQGGYKVVTTLNYKAQKAADEAITRNLVNWGLRGDKNQAAVFAYSPVDGKILVYSGGKDYTKSQYDRVTQAVRPPGSAFKPIVYAAAMEKGISPNDMIEDRPITIGQWSPHNYGNKYRGNIPVYTALMVSSNVCAARMIKEVGIRSVIQIARVLGIETPLEYDYTIALGSNGVKLFEFTRAYSAFANGGFVTQPYSVEKIESPRGKILYEAPKTRMYRELNYRTAAQMTAIMKTVITNGTGRAANIGKPAAGKTGTTDDCKDAYFIGFTPDVVTGVWVGNDDNTE